MLYVRRALVLDKVYNVHSIDDRGAEMNVIALYIRDTYKIHKLINRRYVAHGSDTAIRKHLFQTHITTHNY